MQISPGAAAEQESRNTDCCGRFVRYARLLLRFGQWFRMGIGNILTFSTVQLRFWNVTGPTLVSLEVNTTTPDRIWFPNGEGHWYRRLFGR